ncbi:MAG: cupin domain-containing protein [Alphaproteobacteria bacterium]|nr:cupin domain-containing protein [Alphaproteobacteria bacterium]
MDGGPIPDELRNAPDLDSLVSRAEAVNLQPGWTPRVSGGLWPEPRTPYKPAHWRYDEAKAAMDGALRLIDTKLAERRNFAMTNPAQSDSMATLNTLVCAYQAILPGEHARSHRHSPDAFRIILDSRGAWSCVDGEKHPMETGDIVLTPGMAWHGHGHDGENDAYWFDGLNVPLLHRLEPMFFEDHPDGMEPIKRTVETSPYRFTSAWQNEALDDASDDADGFFGRRIVLDTSSMPAMGIHVHRWAKGFASRPYRCSANQAFVVTGGSGTSSIGEESFAWSYGDTFIAPCWTRIEHRAGEDATVVAMTDEPVMRFCKFWHFEPMS